jgi:cytoskeletal protein CcmA (bactofilin family)
MFSQPKKKPEPAPAIHYILGKDTLWKGEVHCGPHSLRIEGTVEGTLHSEGEITVAPTGLVIGTIHAKHLIVTGKVEGVFRIDECLEIHGTGSVEGDVEMGSLVVDEGGTLQGTCARKGMPRQVMATPPPETDTFGPTEGEGPAGDGPDLSVPDLAVRTHSRRLGRFVGRNGEGKGA